jgi:hypothetical protein
MYLRRGRRKECARWFYSAVRAYPGKVLVHGRYWLPMKQFVTRAVLRTLPQMVLTPTLSHATYQYTLISDSSLVVWYQILRDKCSAVTLPALIRQREELNACYAKLVISTTSDVSSGHSKLISMSTSSASSSDSFSAYCVVSICCRCAYRSPLGPGAVW